MKRAWMCFAVVVSIASASGTAMAGPNCANMLAQAGGAAVGLYAQTKQMIDVCTKNGWGSGPCLAQIAVVGQSSVWMWWTGSNYYCACTNNPNAKYCAALGLLPAPPAPPAGGGGLAPPGPPPPKPLAAADDLGGSEYGVAVDSGGGSYGADAGVTYTSVEDQTNTVITQ